ncbi:MAG: hypothetical protein KAT65_24890 [Methanophagales archaeon]|nr:hypothetical protein [Methanophagales archaeon]
MEIAIGKEYIMRPPFVLEGVDTDGKITTIVEKADDAMKVMIESLMPHHANGMDWYKTEEGQWGREDWFEGVDEKKG